MPLPLRIPSSSGHFASHRRCYGNNTRHELLEVIEGERLSTIFEGVFWAGVNLDHQPISTGSHCGHGHGGNQMPFTGTMAGVGNNGQVAQLLDNGDSTYIHGISGKGFECPDASLAEHHLAIALGKDIFRREQPFLNGG